MTCELCKKQSAILDFNLICCRVRFLLKLGSRDQRTGWLERWRKKDGHAMADEIEMEVKRRWNERKARVVR